MAEYQTLGPTPNIDLFIEIVKEMEFLKKHGMTREVYEDKKRAMRKLYMKVGDKVQFQFVLEKVIGEIVEDRGFIGVGGRRLWGIKYFFGEESSYIELPEVEFEVID